SDRPDLLVRFRRTSDDRAGQYGHGNHEWNPEMSGSRSFHSIQYRTGLTECKEKLDVLIGERHPGSIEISRLTADFPEGLETSREVNRIEEFALRKGAHRPDESLVQAEPLASDV